MAGELQVLEGLGLSPNEAKLYLMLAKGGRMKANELALKTNLQRRTVYDTLAQLEKKGMVGKAQVGGVLTFTPSPPSSLLMFLDEKRDSVEKILPLLSRSFEAQEKTIVSVLYGKAGVKMVMEDVLSLRADFYVYHGQLQFFDTLPTFRRIFNEKRKQLGIRGKFLLLDVPIARERAKLMPFSDIKFIDPSSLSAGVWWTYADRLVLFVLQKDPVTIFIKNAELASTFKKSFDAMFSSNSQVYRGKEGLKAALEQTLKCKETLFIGGRGQVPIEVPEYFWKIYDKQARKQGHIWRNLAYRSIQKTAAAKLPYHKIRYLPKEWSRSPSVVWIYGDCVANVVWLAEPVLFIVEDKHVAAAYRNYFELLWKISEKK